jgi:hypothetical protein
MVIKQFVGDDGNLMAYAWPGGYPIVYLDKDGCDLCPECANKEDRRNLLEGYVHWEGPPIVCGECNTPIDSAYGDPEEESTWVDDMWEAMAKSAKAKAREREVHV